MGNWVKYREGKAQTPFTYENLIAIVKGIYTSDITALHDKIDWPRLQDEATQSVVVKLYELQTDSQRTAFLDHLFNSVFCDGKDYHLCRIEHVNIEQTEYEKNEYNYLLQCKLTLNGLIYRVSEVCLLYESVNFDQILTNNIRTSDVEVDFSYSIIPSNGVSGKTEADTLSDTLQKCGFFDLPKVRVHPDSKTLINLMVESPKRFGQKRKSDKAIGYKMAMVSFLELDKHILSSQALHHKEKLFKILGDIFEANPRTIKGHLGSLNPKSTEIKRYNAYTFIEQVEKDYKS